MKRKRGAGRIVAMLMLLCAVCVFALIASGAKIGFIENYSYNFKMNILGLTRQFGIELPERAQEYLQDLSTPEPAEPPVENSGETAGDEPQADIEKAEDIPETSFDERELEGKAATNSPVALEDAAAAKYARYRGYLLCVNETAVMAFDNTSKSLWAVGIHMSDPILSVNGNYYVIAERGGTKIAAFDGKKQLFQTEADGKIKTASVSSNGDVAVVSEKELYKGAVIVINKNGDRIFAWNSGSDYVTDADIASGSRKLAVSLLNTDNGVTSRVLIFDISKTENTAEVVIEDSVAFDVQFLSEVLNVFADDKICGVSQKGKQLWQCDYNVSKLLHYRTDNSGYKLTITDNNNVPELEVLTARGKQKTLISAEVMPDCIDIRSGMIAYNSGRDLIISTLSGKHQKVHTCPREIRDIYIIDNDNVVVVYNSGLDFIEFK